MSKRRAIPQKLSSPDMDLEPQLKEIAVNPGRVCVIGGGPAGLCTLYALKNIANIEIVCYEKQKQFGGMWIYNEKTGLDDRGEVIPSCMYEGLWTNSPKECLEFAQFTFDDAFGTALPSYITREVILRYLHLFAEKFDLNKYGAFDTIVNNVTFSKETKKFTVETRNCTTKEISKSEYDDCIVCTGHFSYPNVPKFEGMETFPGKVMHASEMRNLEVFRNQRVLSIGSSYSAESVVQEAYKYGAKYITNSWRSHSIGFPWPDDKINERRLVEKVEGSKVHFSDGYSRDFDIIFLATGYKHEFPFLEEKLQLKTENLLYCDNLYKGVLFLNNPKLAYIGAQNLVNSFTLFMQEALWYAAMLKGKIKIPDNVKEMQEHTNTYLEEQKTLATVEDLVRFQQKHVEEIGNEAGAPGVDVCEKFLKWDGHRHGKIMEHRNECFASIYGNKTMAVKPAKPWMDCTHTAEYLGKELCEKMKLNEWIESVGGTKYDWNLVSLQEKSILTE